jgi:hypothetical protein
VTYFCDDLAVIGVLMTYSYDSKVEFILRVSYISFVGEMQLKNVKISWLALVFFAQERGYFRYFRNKWQIFTNENQPWKHCLGKFYAKVFFPQYAYQDCNTCTLNVMHYKCIYTFNLHEHTHVHAYARTHTCTYSHMHERENANILSKLVRHCCSKV